MTDITIPPEAVEAVADIIAVSEHGMPLQSLTRWTQTRIRRSAAAALRAGIAASQEVTSGAPAPRWRGKMTDIVERLRHGCSCNFPDTPCGAEEECRAAFDAADEITRLRAENERQAAELRSLRAALKPFVCDCEGEAICIGECMHRNARAALDGQPAPGKEE